MAKKKLEVGKMIVVIILFVRECRGEMKGSVRDLHISFFRTSNAEAAR